MPVSFRLPFLIATQPVPGFHCPSCAIGRGEFDGYVAFFFARGGKVALECAWEGNAIYVFPEDRWLSLSKLTKSDLLETHGHELERIIHDSGGQWFSRLKRSLRLPA
jgi:hypothetical protein